jgi:hypothetical protein
MTRRTKPNFGSRCLHFKRNGYEGHTNNGLFLLPPGAQRPPGAGAVAHMSLHLINYVKEPDHLAAAPLPAPELPEAVLPRRFGCEPAGEAPI